jgi:hypothetical protein
MNLRTLAAALAAVFICGAGHTFAATMQCQPYAVFTGAPYPGQGPYTADADGIVSNVSQADVGALHNGGCDLIGNQGLTLIARLVGANMNSTSDQPMTSFMSPNAYYIPSYMIVKDCSVSLTTAQGAVYDTASKSGTTLFGTTSQAYSACIGAGTAQPISATAAGAKVVDSAKSNPPILSLTTGQGAAAIANVYVYGYVLGQ